MIAYVVDRARQDFDRRYPHLAFGPVVALIAAYEEEANIGAVLKAVPTLVDDLEVSTLVVVDGDTDGTAQVALDAGVATCVLPVNLGQGAALRLGYGLAAARGARYVVTLDADGQNDPAELPRMLQPLLDGTADFVIASRRLGTDGTTDRFRRAGVTFYAWALNTLSGQHLTDSSNGYRAFRVEVLEDIAPHLVQDQYQTAEVVHHRRRPGLADHPAADAVAPAGLGDVEEGWQPDLRPPLRPGHRDHLGPAPAGRPAPGRIRPGSVARRSPRPSGRRGPGGMPSAARSGRGCGSGAPDPSPSARAAPSAPPPPGGCAGAGGCGSPWA